MADKIVKAFRRIAAELKTTPDEKVLFPGWDIENSTPEETIQRDAIRHAAFAIIGLDNPDAGDVVSFGQLAELIHYIGDML